MPKIRSIDVGTEAPRGFVAGERLRESNLRPSMRVAYDVDAEHNRDLRPETPEYDLDPRNIPQIPPLSGYVQRWVRKPDPNRPGDGNFHQKLLQGWRPRPIETLPTHFQEFLHVKGGKAEGLEYGQLILMQIPEQSAERRRALVEREKAKFRSFTDEIAAATASLQGITNGTGMHLNTEGSRRDVTRGRVPGTLAD